MCKSIGEEKARDILGRAIRRAAIDAGKEFASRADDGANLESFKAIQHLWTKDDALTIEVIDEKPGVFDFNVTRCRYAETYRAMGLSDIGDILSCNRDGAFCEGYYPRTKLTRTQTIMRGASHCNSAIARARGRGRKAAQRAGSSHNPIGWTSFNPSQASARRRRVALRTRRRAWP
jgi:hypothetical protein